MKSLTSTTIVAIVAGTIGLAALTPVAFAQQGPQHGQQFDQPMQMGQFGKHRIERMRGARGPEVRGGGLLSLVCSDRGAERAEIGFVRLSHRLELTTEQQALFDDLKSSALTAQTQFAEQCAQPAAPTTADATPTVPNPVERLTTQLGNDALRLELMQGLLPKLEAFYDSLSDDQKASLMPRPRDNRGFRNRGNQPPAQPGQPAEPATPAPEVEPTAFVG